jgi:hypothetical protein
MPHAVEAPVPPVSPHPAQRFDFSVAEVFTLGSGRVGYVLVLAEPYARQTGHLWWKTLSDPQFTLEIWSVIHGEFEDTFLSDIESAVEGLQRGEWPLWPTLDQDASTYQLRWLDIDESRRVFTEVFDLDLAEQRRRRKRLD